MRKYTKVLFFSLAGIIFLSILIFSKPRLVNAEDLTQLSIDDFTTYLTQINNIEEYYSDINQMIITKFPDFNVVENLINGESQYKILEITPRTYLGDQSSVSDLDYNIEKITNIYKTALANNSALTGNFLISNTTNFSVDVMTIKQLVNNYEEIDGLYDAIVFASGDYSTEQVLSCDFNYNEENLEYESKYVHNKLRYKGNLLNSLYHGYGKEYNEDGKLIYEGTFKEGLYHGFGTLYNSSQKPSYIGGFIDGKKSCYGVSYSTSNFVNYEGQWVADVREGYGTSFTDTGDLEYTGYFDNDKPSPYTQPTEVLNDITDIKATEIIDGYIKKGLPVFMSDDILIDNSSNLYNYFNPLVNEYENIFMLDYDYLNPNNNIEFYSTLSILKITELLSYKPVIEFIEKPIDYHDSISKTYSLNETVNFNLNLTNKEESNLSFYLDVNQNENFDLDELVYEFPIQTGNNSFSFQIPNVYSGLLKYKIVVDNFNQQSLYTGTLRVRTEARQDIRVLNIVSEMVYNKNGLFVEELFNNYFTNNEDYNISVTSCKIKDFSKNGSYNECGHKRVMDFYDVILLGQDIFNKNVPTSVYHSIKDQLDEGKPFIFTSSITKGNKKWMEYFADELSLSDYRTDLYRLNNNINKLQIINDSNFILYPFNLFNEELTVPEGLNYVFNEEYQMDLTNPNLVPLLNMYNSNNLNFDRFDSYNNYYYTKNENVVYLNVGSSMFKPYKDIEHKLLVDSIVNLYIQDKAKDTKVSDMFTINASNNYENGLIDVKDPVSFGFTVYSNKNENFNYKLFINSTEVTNHIISNNEYINVELNDFIFVTNDSFKEVRICAEIENENGEKQTYTFYVYVGNQKTYNITYYNPIVNSINNYIETHVEGKYFNQYRINFDNISVNDLNYSVLPETIYLRNILFRQKIPENITYDSQGFVVEDNTLTKDLGNIIYTLSSDGYYVPNIKSKSFTLPFTANAEGDYTFEPSTITFNGIGNDIDTIANSGVSFKAADGLSPTMVEPTFENYIFIPYGSCIEDLATKFNFTNEGIIKSIKFEETDSYLSLIEINGKYKLVSDNIGEQNVKIIVEDIFGNKYNNIFLVKTYEPIDMLELNGLVLYLNEEMPLPLTILPNDIDVRNLFYEITGGNGEVEIIRSGEQFIVIAKAIGHIDIVVYGYNEYGDVISQKNTICVNEDVPFQFNNLYLQLLIGDIYTVDELRNNLIINSADITFEDITFESLDEGIITIDSNNNLVVTGTGTVVIKAINNNFYSQMIIKVSEPLSEENSGFDEELLSRLKLYQGYKQYLEKFINLSPEGLTVDDVEITFEIINDENGLIEDFDQVANTMTTYSDKAGFITIGVTITQQNKLGEIIEVTDQYTFEILVGIDTDEDSLNNKH